MPFILSGNVGSATAATGYDVANSARFNDGSSDYLDHTHNAVTSTRKQTFSVWVKRSHLTSYQYIISTKNGTSTDRDGIAFSASDQIDIRYGAGSSSPIRLTTNRLFRDPSAWYHIVVAVDTTQGTAGNRIKLYVNGVQETSFATSSYMDQNYDFALNAKTDQATGIGVDGRLNDAYFDGYFSEFVAIDGLQLAADQFGEFDDSGIWKPIDVSGLTFGDAGFYMNFETAAELGTDVSGNSNTFAENNLTAVDQATDTCTNNFATMNPLDNFYAGSTFSEGNLNLVMADSPTTWNTSTIGVSSGKWYFEVKELAEGASGSSQVGVADRPTVAADEELGGIATTFAYTSNGRFRTGGSQTAADKATWGVNDVIGIALDMDASPATVTFTKNGSAAGSTQNLTTTGTGFYFLAIGAWVDGSVTFSANFGSPAYSESGGNSDGDGFGNFKTAPPSGHFALCTKNLAEYG